MTYGIDRIDQIADEINGDGYGYRLVRGTGWPTEWVWEDRSDGLCSPATDADILAKAAALGIGVSA